jgi:glucose/arabinose dehydrogenase
MTPTHHPGRTKTGIGTLIFLFFFCSEFFYAHAQPTPLAPGITVEQFAGVAPLCTRMAMDPISKDLFYLTLYGDIHRIDMQGNDHKDSVVFTTDDHHIVNLQGIVFYDRKFYLIGDVPFDTSRSQGLIMRATLKPNDVYKWDTVAYTELYPKGNTSFDHGFSGITINPTGDSLFINSGSRTDHGEEQNNGGLFPGTREVPLTSAIFRIPANAKKLYLPNDSAGLAPYLYADGTRNSYDLAFGPNGELFGTENSGERDDPEELNWIRKGKHYGFPWIAGGDYNPQQFPGYDPLTDPLLMPERNPAKMIYFYNDPGFPPMPPNLQLQQGVQNLGPDANYFRDSLTSLMMQADETGRVLRSFSPHRSPLGLIFDLNHALGLPYCGDAFMTSYQSQGDSLGITPNHAPGCPLDPSEDLVHLELSKNADGSNYTTFATRIVTGFKHPVDAVIDSNIIYIIEISSAGNGHLWKITMPARPPKSIQNGPGCVDLITDPVGGFDDMIAMLPHNADKQGNNPISDVTLELYPSPFISSLEVTLTLREDAMAELTLCDVTGKVLKQIIPQQKVEAGLTTLHVNTTDLATGLYILRGFAGGEIINEKLMKLK